MLKKYFISMISFSIMVIFNSCRSELKQKPNIILIMADDLGFSDLGSFGSEINTPNLDQLAKNGLRFTQFYNNAKCVPSRISLLTGLYPDDEAQNAKNIAQILKSAGYNTLMTGKNGSGIIGLPTEEGFDRFFGLNSGASNYFNPGLRRPNEKEPGRKYYSEQRPWAEDGTVMQPFTPNDKNFYATDAFSDYAVRYLDEYGNRDSPFFLYVSFSAPHFPLQAWPEDIAKYKGKYMIGWDAIRKQRYERLINLGIIDENWKLPKRDINVKKWDEITNKADYDLSMAVYAAMIDRMDQGIGKIMAKVNELGIENNTLVLFLSDNGSCAEDYKAFKTTAPEIPPGPMESYRTLGVEWANASNTPFRKYKWWCHEGGISTPLIAYWPNVIKNVGGINHQVGHIMDIMATCLDIADIASIKNDEISPIQTMKGKSLVPIFEGQTRDEHKFLFWSFSDSYAMRKGNWKLVLSHSNPRAGIDYFSEESDLLKTDNENIEWELYNLKSDRTELYNLAEKHPEIIADMLKERKNK